LFLRLKDVFYEIFLLDKCEHPVGEDKPLNLSLDVQLRIVIERPLGLDLPPLFRRNNEVSIMEDG